MKKFLLLSTLALSTLAFCFQPVFADEWPENTNTSEEGAEYDSSPFSDTAIFDNDNEVVNQSPAQNTGVVDQAPSMSATDSDVKEITDKRSPIFDDSVRQIGEIDYTDVSQLLPDVDINDAVEWGQRKTYEIIQLMQTFVQPICIISFIISAFMFLFGTIAHNNWAGRGLMGIIMSSVVYALVMFAPVIVQTFTAWVSS